MIPALAAALLVLALLEILLPGRRRRQAPPADPPMFGALPGENDPNPYGPPSRHDWYD